MGSATLPLRAALLSRVLEPGAIQRFPGHVRCSFATSFDRKASPDHLFQRHSRLPQILLPPLNRIRQPMCQQLQIFPCFLPYLSSKLPLRWLQVRSGWVSDAPLPLLAFHSYLAPSHVSPGSGLEAFLGMKSYDCRIPRKALSRSRETPPG